MKGFAEQMKKFFIFRSKFHKYFSVEIGKYVDMYGFNIGKFDKEITRSENLDDISMEDVVLKEYGKGAVDLIKTLLEL